MSSFSAIQPTHHFTVTISRLGTSDEKALEMSTIHAIIRLITLDDEDMAKINDAHHEIELHRICNIHHLLWIELDGRRTLQGWTEVDFGWEDEEGNWLT